MSSIDPLADVIRQARKGWGAGDEATDFDRTLAAAVRAHYRDAAPISDEQIEAALAPHPAVGCLKAHANVRALIVEATATANARIAELETEQDAENVRLIAENDRLIADLNARKDWITGARIDIDGLTERAETAEAEVARHRDDTATYIRERGSAIWQEMADDVVALRATVERVRALADAAEETSTLVDADDIRAALDSESFE